MAEMANPRKIIDSYKQTSYFGAPARLSRFETDPQKLGADGSLTGALKGLLRGGAGATGNVGVDLYNAVAKTGTPTTTPAERTAAFASQNVARYRDPVAPAPQAAPVPAPKARPDFPSLLGRDIAAMDKAAAPSPQAAPVVARRPSLRSAPAGRQAPLTTPTVSWAAPEEAPVVEAPERGYIESGGTRYYIPGSKAYDGVGATGAPQFENAPVVQPRPGEPGWTGSQAAWEAEQAVAPDGNPLFFRRQALKLELQKQKEAELAGGSLRNKYAADVVNTLSTADERDAKLPGEILQQGATFRKTLNEVESEQELRPYEIGYKQGAARLSNASADSTLAEIPLDAMLKTELSGLYRKQGAAMEAKADTDLALEKQRLINEQKQRELEARINSPTTKADAEYYAGLAAIAGVPPSTAAEAANAGYPRAQKGKKRLFRADIPQGMVNAAGEVYDPSVPAGYRPSGKFTPDGKPILLDAQGKKFVQ